MTTERRIEELETALENLVDNVEYVIDDELATQALQEAFIYAQQVLADEGYEFDAEDLG